jgi:hypothetical protein
MIPQVPSREKVTRTVTRRFLNRLGIQEVSEPVTFLTHVLLLGGMSVVAARKMVANNDSAAPHPKATNPP